MRAALLPLLVLTACGGAWKPVTIIEGLRVIGVRADPPEVRPGQPSALEALVLDPTRPGQNTTMVWLGCEPDPYGAGRGACNDLASIGDQNALIDSMRLPDGIKLIGLGNRATYATSPSLFDVLAADDDRRKKGTVGTIASLAVAADVPLNATMEQLAPILAKVQSREIASQLTLFRVRVSENAVQNVNPSIDAFIVDGETLPKGATAMIQPFAEHYVDLAAHDMEPFEEIAPSGVVQKQERLVVSWYSTVGRFSNDRVALGTDVKSRFVGPGDPVENDPIPDSRRGTFWAVVRDSRGGQVWADWPFFVCDLGRPWPRVTQTERSGGRLTLRGENLEQILDVVSKATPPGVAVRGGYSMAAKAWVGDDQPGPLELRTRGCGRAVVP